MDLSKKGLVKNANVFIFLDINQNFKIVLFHGSFLHCIIYKNYFAVYITTLLQNFDPKKIKIKHKHIWFMRFRGFYAYNLEKIDCKNSSGSSKSS